MLEGNTVAGSEDRDNIAPENLRETAHRNFMTALLERKFRPGHLVSQREIAKVTGNSLPSVREALKLLEAEGVVKLLPKRGIEIREMSRKEIKDAFQLRLMIELEAIPVFVEKASGDEIEALRQETTDIIDATARNLNEELELFQKRVELDHKLHRRIVESLGNPLISAAHRNTETIMLLSRLSLPPQFHTSGPAFHEHMKLLEEIAARREQGAKETLRAHLESACQRAVASASK